MLKTFLLFLFIAATMLPGCKYDATTHNVEVSYIFSDKKDTLEIAVCNGCKFGLRLIYLDKGDLMFIDGRGGTYAAASGVRSFKILK